MSNSLLSKKSSMISRNKIIIYIITTILILGIVTGFTNTFNTDNSRHSAGYGETIVMEAEPPMNGTPSDYDLLSTLQFAAYRIHHSKYFRGETDGKVSADIGIGSYTQYLTNTRVVYNENIVFTETISTSSLKSLAEQKYIDNGIIIYRPADKINGNDVTYKPTAVQMSYDDYSGKYGSVPNQLSKYIINKDTILSVKDENAQTQLALNGGDGDGEIGFEVPDRLVPNADGHYVFTITLDPTASSLYYRNEVRTLGGADQNPKFYSVQITVTVDSDFYPISTRTLENYDIEIPVLGAMNCSGDNLEVFSMFNDENGEVPERDFFQAYVDEAKSRPGYIPPVIDNAGPLSASDYLASAFECYLSGERDLDLTADIKIGNFSAYGLKLSVNLNTLETQAMLGNGLYIKYSGDNIYVKNNDINGYIAVSDISELTENPDLKALLGGLGELDVNKLFGGDMLDVIFGGCEMTTADGVTDIPMSFALNLSEAIPSLGSAQIDASIKISDDDMSLKSICGTVAIGDTLISIEVKPLATPPVFPALDGATDLSGILDFVPDIISTAKQKTYGIDGTIVVNDMSVGVSAYIDRTDGITAEATLDVGGLNVDIKYIEDTVYAEALGVVVRGTADELPELMSAVLDLTGADKYGKILKSLLPNSLNQVADIIKTLSVDDNALSVGLDFIGIPINATLTRGDGKLTGAAFGASVDMFGIKADIAANLKLSEPKAHAVTAPASDNYLTFTDLATIISEIKPYIQDGVNYTAALDGYIKVGGKKTTVNGSLALDRIADKSTGATKTAVQCDLSTLGQDIRITYVDGTAYIAVGEIEAKLALSDINELLPSVKRLLDLFVDADALPEIDVTEILTGAIQSASMKDGALEVALSVGGYTVNASVDLKQGKALIWTIIEDAEINLGMTVYPTNDNHNITAPVGSYVDVKELSATLDAAADIINAKAITATVSVDIAGQTFDLNVETDFGDGLKARITENTLGLEVVIIGDTAYISIGSVKLCGTLSDATALYEEVRKQYTELPAIADILNILPADADIQALLAFALGAINSLTPDNGVIAADVTVNGYALSVELNTDLSEIAIDATVGTTKVEATILPAPGCGAISAPSGEYSSIAEVTKLVPAVFALMDTKTYSADFGVTATAQDMDEINVTGDAVIDLKDGISASASINALGQNIDLAYDGDIVYLGVQTLRFKLSPTQVTELMPTVNGLLGALGITLPDLGAATDGLKNALFSDNLKSTIIIGIGCVQSLTISDGAITAILSYDGYSVTLSIRCSAQDGVYATLETNINDTELSVDLTLAPTDKTVNSPDKEEYSDAADLAPALEAAGQIINAGGVQTTATVTIDDITLNAGISGTVQDGEIKAVISEDSLGLSVIILGDTAYIEIGGIKVSGRLDDVTGIMNAIIPNLPDPIRPYVLQMNELIMGIIPSHDELYTDDEPDIEKIADIVLAMLTKLSVNGETIEIGITRNVLSANIGIAADLSYVSGDVALTFDGIGGPFGEHYVMPIGLALQKITAAEVTVPTVSPDEYVPASDILSALNCVLPLVKENALRFGISATVYGQTIAGEVYVDFGEYKKDTVAAQIDLNVAGAPIKLAVIQRNLYIDVNKGSIRLVQPLTKNGIESLIARLDEAVELGIQSKLQAMLDGMPQEFDIAAVCGMLQNITLSPAENGMTVNATFGNTTVKADIEITDGKLSAVNIDCDIDGKTVKIGLSVDTDENGVITEIKSTEANIMGVEIGFDVTIAPAARHEVAVDGDYMNIDELIPFISPVMNMIDVAQTANTITVDISDAVVAIAGKEMTVGGVIDISLDPLAVRAVLTLFSGTDDALDLNVVYENNVVYIGIGTIKLSFNTITDMQTLDEAISNYLPEYLSLKDIGSMLSTLSALIDNAKSMADAKTPDEIVGIMFRQDNVFGKSMIEQVLGMIRLGKFNGAVTASVTVMDAPIAVTLDVVPIIDNGYIDFKLGATVLSLITIDLTAKPTFSGDILGAVTPSDADGYTPAIEFVTAVINAVNTLTAKAPDKVTTDDLGNTTTVSQIAFEIDTFAFDYDIFQTETAVDEQTGETVEVKDEAGRAKIAKDAAGNKIVRQHIDVFNVSGQKALKFGMTTTTVKGADGTETKSTRLAVEAHIGIGIIGADGNPLTGFPIELNLYVQPMETEEQGLAYLYYKESNGYGEKISIDYTSVMELAAAVLDILSVDDKTVESLLGEYRLDIDKTVFESMAISGLDSIRDLLNSLVKAVDEAKLALSDVKAAWSSLQNAGSIDNLIYEITNDNKSVESETEDGETVAVEEPTIKTKISNAISHVKSAVAKFGKDDDSENTAAQPTDINGALVGKVVNAVSFAYSATQGGSSLSADVDNAVATGTEGKATVEVTSSADKITSIGVNNLDVNTAKLNTFDMQFAPITEMLTVTVPSDYTTEQTKNNQVRYADFANIKHLLFDVMNTANLMEFEIGGGSGDKINLNVLSILKVDITYRAKVYIIDQGKNANPRYKTAADIQLNIPETIELGIPALPKCTTRLFFYDNVLYMHGVESWKAEWKWIKYNWTVNEKDYKFTINELMDVAGEVDEQGNKVGIEKLFKKVVFRLLPLRESLGSYDLHNTIIDAVKNPPEANASLNTVAQIFKQYTYNVDENGKGVHNLVIGLKELALNGSLRDATVKLTGANDGDNNIYDNFISHAWLQTSFGTNPEKDSAIATITLDATLTNTKVVNKTYYYTDKELTKPSTDNEPTDYWFTRNELVNTGTSQTVINGVGYSFGKSCNDNSNPKSMIDVYLKDTSWNAMDW